MSAILGHIRQLFGLGSRVMGGKLRPPTPGTPVQNNCLKPHCRLYKLQVAQKRYTLRVHICGLNTQSGPRSRLKRLSESREKAALLEPVLRACLLPLAAQGAEGSLDGSQAVLGSQEAVFGAIFLHYIKRVSALQSSLDY